MRGMSPSGELTCGARGLGGVCVFADAGAGEVCATAVPEDAREIPKAKSKKSAAKRAIDKAQPQRTTRINSGICSRTRHALYKPMSLARASAEHPPVT